MGRARRPGRGRGLREPLDREDGDRDDALHDLGRLGEAVSRYRAAISREPVKSSAAAHNDFGTALAELGRLREAIVEFKEALRLEPTNDRARQNLTRATARGGGRS